MDKLNNCATVFFNRLEQTWNFYLDIEKEVRKKINEIYGQISEGSELFPEFIGLDDRYKGLFREGLLIQICSLLEHSIVQVCKQLTPDYEVEIKSKKRGNWLDKHLVLLGRRNINGLDAKDEQSFSDFIRIRNCFVHSNGIIHQCKYSKKTSESIHRLQGIGREQNTEIIELSSDGYIILGVDALPEIFSRGEEVMRPIFEYAFQELQSR
jgi:hypothetical protein